jgi:hypothetical protein
VTDTATTDPGSQPSHTEETGLARHRRKTDIEDVPLGIDIGASTTTR